MRHIPVLSLILFSLASASTAAAQTPTALHYDSSRQVFTLAPTIKKVTPGVVSISTIEAEEEDGTQLGGIGSGVILDAEKGLILTNDHVIADARKITVILSDKRRFEATVRGQDPETDLALLEITADKLIALPVSMEDNIEVGDLVIAVGNPFGLTHSVSTGIVSAIGRTDENPLGWSDLIQTDAAINPGNSGGALVNSAGNLIGINSAIVAKDRGSSGIGFAIPAHTFRTVADQLETYGSVTRGSLGVMISPVSQTARDRLNLRSLNGAHLVEVTVNGAASEAGLRVDDVVTRFAGRAITNSSDLRYAVGLIRPDTITDITYMRDGRLQRGQVTVRAKGYVKTASFEPDVEVVLFSEEIEN